MGTGPGGLVAVGISGSPSATSKSPSLVEYALAQPGKRGAATRLIDLATLPADALLARGSAHQVSHALALGAHARIVVARVQAYRATYKGVHKVFFMLLAPYR